MTAPHTVALRPKNEATRQPGRAERVTTKFITCSGTTNSLIGFRSQPGRIIATHWLRGGDNADQHVIIVRPGTIGTRFDVVVEPSPAWANFNVERPSVRDAWRYAESLRKIQPTWKIRDETGAAS